MQGDFLRLLQKAGKDGIHIDKVMKVLGQTSLASAATGAHRLNKRGYKIERHNNIFTLVSSPKNTETQNVVEKHNSILTNLVSSPKGSKTQNTKTPQDNTPIYLRLANLLEERGTQGVDKHELAKSSGIDLSKLYSHIHILKEKKYKVVCSDGRYYLKGQAALVGTKVHSQAPAVKKDVSDIPPEVFENLLKLNEGERASADN